MNLPRIDTSNLWDKTYNMLKSSIIRRSYTPNYKLSIPELAEQMGVSRTPVRDALNRLEMEGLVKTISKVGTFVVPIKEQDVLNITDTRLMLEFWTVDKLPQIDRVTMELALTRMRNIVSASVSRLESSQLHDYLQADYNLDFHLEFMKLGQNKHNLDIYLKTMNYRFITMNSSIVTNDMIRSAADQHQGIIDAIVGGDTASIKQVILLHLEDAQKQLLAKIRQNGGTI